jgi:hypothetical protein
MVMVVYCTGWLVPQPSRAQIRMVCRPGSAYQWNTAAELTGPNRLTGRAWQVLAGTAVTPLPSPKSTQAAARGTGAEDDTWANAVTGSPVNVTGGPATAKTSEDTGRPPGG